MEILFIKGQSGPVLTWSPIERYRDIVLDIGDRHCYICWSDTVSWPRGPHSVMQGSSRQLAAPAPSDAPDHGWRITSRAFATDNHLDKYDRFDTSPTCSTKIAITDYNHYVTH